MDCSSCPTPMDPANKSESSPSRQRPRAKRACKVCNTRRVRCDVMESHPCHNCQMADVPCELMSSRRGKYQRRLDSGSSSARRVMPEAVWNTQTSTFRQLRSHDTQKLPGYHTGSSGPRLPEVVTRDPPALTETQVSSPWVEPPAATDELDRIVYFGESSALVCVASEAGSPPQNLQYRISEAIDTKASILVPATGRTFGMLEFLKQEGMFNLPNPREVGIVLQAYFKWFHPCFPIVDRVETSNAYLTNTLSPLLLQGMLFIGSSYCDDTTIQRMGFKHRHEAKHYFYKHVKSLYHTDWETNKEVVLQALFLLSFWRAGPRNEKDTRHWLGSAISLAQARGFHRSLRFSSAKAKHAKLRKRIWWSLYVRDRQCSASVGLPVRIRDEDCDVEMLHAQDFEEEGIVTAPRPFGATAPEHSSYFIQMVKLAILLGRIVSTEYIPRDSGGLPEKSKFENELVNWETSLPAEMIINARTAATATTADDSGKLWAFILHLAYNHLHILLHRSTYIGLRDVSRDLDLTGALDAACRSARIIEDMLAQDLIQYGQIHLIDDIFSALCIQILHIRCSEGVAKQLAEHRAQICLLGLKELRKSWDVNNWVLQLLFQFLDEYTLTRLRVSDLEDTKEGHKSARPNVAPNLDGEEVGSATVREDAGRPGPLQEHGIDAELMPNFLDLKAGEDYLFYPGQPGTVDSDSNDFSQYFGSLSEPMDDLGMEELHFLSRNL